MVYPLKSALQIVVSKYFFLYSDSLYLVKEMTVYQRIYCIIEAANGENKPPVDYDSLHSELRGTV